MRALATLSALACLLAFAPLALAQDDPTDEVVCVEDIDASFVLGSTTEVNVTWALVEGAASYDVYMSVEGGEFENMGTANFVGGEPGRGAMGFGGFHGNLTFSVAVDGVFSEDCPVDSIFVEGPPSTEIPFFPTPMAALMGVAVAGLVVAGIVYARRRG